MDTNEGGGDVGGWGVQDRGWIKGGRIGITAIA